MAAASVSSARKAKTEDFYRFLVERVTDYAIFAIARDGTVVSWNSGAEHAFGYTAREVLGRSIDIVFTPQDIADGAAVDELLLVKAQGRTDCERWDVRKDRSRFWRADTVQPLRNDAGEFSGYTKIVRDMTEAHLASMSLRESEERMCVLLESIEDYAIFSLSPMGVIETWNVGAERLFGYVSPEAIGEHFALYTRQDAALGIPKRSCAELTADGKADARRGGTPERSDLGFVKVAHDITERKEMQDAVRHEAFHNGLTGLPNRSLFLEHLRRSIAQSLHHYAHVRGIFIDVANSKSLNDTLGHVIADRLLIAFGNRLSSKGARSLLRRASASRSALSHYEKPERVLRDADVAVYAAKTQGRSKSALFGATVYRELVLRSELDRELRYAVRNEELQTVYQPILALENARVAGFEAFVRWDHPSRGRFSVGLFIDCRREQRDRRDRAQFVMEG